MLKKLISIFVCLCLAFTIVPIPALAHSGHNCSSIVLSEEFLASAEVEISSDVLLLSRTRQVPTSEEMMAMSEAQNSCASYVKEIVFLVPNEAKSVEDVYNEVLTGASPLSSGNKTETDRDASISVEGTLTITYDRQTIDGDGYIKLTGVSGGYRILDRQVRVNSQAINAGCSGWNLGKGWVDQSTDFPESSASWSYTPPSDWLYVSTNTGPSRFVGANVTYTLQRIGNTYTWRLYLVNNV